MFGSEVSVFGHFVVRQCAHAGFSQSKCGRKAVMSAWQKNERDRMFGLEVSVFGHFVVRQCARADLDVGFLDVGFGFGR